MYKVKESDLKGQIKYFPIEIVQKMVSNQVHQGNKANVGVFQIDPSSCVDNGGFDWARTKEGNEFWNSVIGNINFDVFFKKYPKKKEKKHFVGVEDVDELRNQILDNIGEIVVLDDYYKNKNVTILVPSSVKSVKIEYNELVRNKYTDK